MARRNTDNETDESVENQDVIENNDSQPERKSEVCQIILKKPDLILIDFKGFGVSLNLPSEEFDSKDYITVEYEGEIGEPSFVLYPIL